jgi:hypothetical protein
MYIPSYARPKSSLGFLARLFSSSEPDDDTQQNDRCGNAEAFVREGFLQIERPNPPRAAEVRNTESPRYQPANNNKSSGIGCADAFMRALSDPSITISPSLFFNKPETRVFYAAQNALKDLNLSHWHVHGQVSYGRIFKTSASEDCARRFGFNPHSAFNSKSADVVISDNTGKPVIVIEYQGSGHDAQNDPIKKLVCSKSGVSFCEIYPEPIFGDQPMSDHVDMQEVKEFIIDAIQQQFVSGRR